MLESSSQQILYHAKLVDLYVREMLSYHIIISGENGLDKTMKLFNIKVFLEKLISTHNYSMGLKNVNVKLHYKNFPNYDIVSDR